MVGYTSHFGEMCSLAIPVIAYVSAIFVGMWFRSDFVLVSEKNHMKVHKNQWIGPCHILPHAFSESQAED